MKTKLYALLALAGVFALMVFALMAGLVMLGPSAPSLLAQQPSDQSVTRPDHLAFAGDLGTCNEGETEYNMLTHVAKRCANGGNSWLTIAAASATTASSGYTYQIGPLGTPILTGNVPDGLSVQSVCHVTYNFAVDGGTTPIVPAGNCIIPANAVITNVGVQATTSVTAAGSATVALGCVGGTACGSSALMAATAKASLTAGTFGQSIPVPQTASTWIKTTAATGITLTIAIGPLTAGVIEIYVYFVTSSS